jgi:hypothetical protein
MFAEISGISTADVVETGLFIITVVLAVLTWLNVRAAKELIKLQIEPVVYIDVYWEKVENRGAILLISVKNRGGGAARNIHLDVDNDFPVGPPLDPWKVAAVSPDNTFKHTYAVEKGIKEIGPYQELLIAHVFEKERLRERENSTISFTYETTSGKIIEPDPRVIDFAMLASAYKYW